MQSCCKVDFQLIWRRSFANPLFAIEYVDLTNDGMEEIAVASLSGLHVLQVSVDSRGGDAFPSFAFTLSMHGKEGMESI